MTPKDTKNPHAERLLNQVNHATGINKILKLMQALRDPQGGCDWDLAQTYSSLVPFTLEEAYEVAGAIEENDFDSLKEELGDLLFQVVFYAQIAAEEGRFEFFDVVDVICEKLVRRHPHVFANVCYANDDELKQAWDQIKQQERSAKLALGRSTVQDSSVLADVPKALPALSRADKIQKRAAQVGFDWRSVEQVWDKVAEESDEVLAAALSGDRAHLEEELGDLMFAVVNLTRHYGVDSEVALKRATQKFEKRFRQVESDSNGDLNGKTIEELEALWQQAKLIVD
ncbi:nucleoside triphosphate pyrophosphohydrolase [Aliikangiella sp. IMCC44632]